MSIFMTILSFLAGAGVIVSMLRWSYHHGNNSEDMMRRHVGISLLCVGACWLFAFISGVYYNN